MNVLILTDGQGWIVDRITMEMVKRMPYNFTIKDYTQIKKEDFIAHSNENDLVHYQNWDCERLMDCFEKIEKPILMSIRSFRFPKYVLTLQKKSNIRFHIINKKMKKSFPNASYIPDGVFDEFFRNNFTVGFAGRPDEYKGFMLIKQACDELGVIFKPALNLRPIEMPDFYRSIDLLVCASLNEGHGAPIMECLAMNRPVLTVDVGTPSLLDIPKIDRNIESIKKGILQHYTYLKVKRYNWNDICQEMQCLYEKTICRNDKKTVYHNCKILLLDFLGK